MPRTPAPRRKKAFGQHHLVDGSLCRPLVDFLNLEGESGAPRVLEIGPGGGVLTRELLAAGARVRAFELDREWAFELAASPLGANPRLELVVGDALDLAWERLPAPTPVAGNLPYAVATAIIRRLLDHPERVPRAAFLIQKEVGDRLVAGPGDPAYGALSVLVAARARVVPLGRVKAGSFRPPPKVDGALVGLELGPPPVPEELRAALEPFDAFEATVHAAFARRRKTLRNSLAGTWGKDLAGTVLERAALVPGRRAETLSLEEFLTLELARREVV